MSRTEDVVISAVLRGAGVRSAIKLGAHRDLFKKRRAEWMYLESNKGVSRAVFKSRFPYFKVLAVDPDEVEVGVAQLLRNNADYDLGKLFETMQRQLGRKEPTELAAQIEAGVRTIMLKYSRGNDVDILNNWQVAYNHVEKAQQAVIEGTQIGYPFGIPSLDKIIGGMQAPDLITIVARQGQFKTWVSIYFAVNALLAGGKPLYASLEMSVEQIALRAHAVLSQRLAAEHKDIFKKNFGNKGLMMGAVDLKEYKQFCIRAKKQLAGGGFIVPDTRGNFNMSTMVAQVEKHKPDIAFFDYFGLAVGGNGRVDNWAEAAQVSRTAKHNIAKDYGIPFVMNAQANRSAETEGKNVPQLHHIGLSDAVGADSDRVLSLRYHKGELTMGVIKNRLGSTGDVLTFDMDIDQGILKEIGRARAEVKKAGKEDEEA